MPSKPEPEPSLLERITAVPDASLAVGVKAAEGMSGSTVEPIYSTRKMRCYSVTESELKQINLANIAITAFSSTGSALLAFWLDIFKDTILSEKVPEVAQTAIGYVQPILLILGIGFWVAAGAALWWRRDMIKLIKQESTNP